MLDMFQDLLLTTYIHIRFNSWELKQHILTQCMRLWLVLTPHLVAHLLVNSYEWSFLVYLLITEYHPNLDYKPFQPTIWKTPVLAINFNQRCWQAANGHTKQLHLDANPTRIHLVTKSKVLSPDVLTCRPMKKWWLEDYWEGNFSGALLNFMRLLTSTFL